MSASNRLRGLSLAFVLGIVAVFLAASYHQSKLLTPELWQLPTKLEVNVLSHQTENMYLQVYQVYSHRFNQSFNLAHYDKLQMMQMGECYELTGKFKPKRALGNPTTAHQAKQQWANREFIRGYVVNRDPITRIACRHGENKITTLRHTMKSHIHESSISATAKAMIIALVLGERNDLTDEHREVLQQTGTAHLLAISGLHIGLVFGITWFIASILLRPFFILFQHFNMLILASVFALISSGFYVLISGAGVSSLRAWGMLCVITLLMVARQRLSILSVLILTVATILIFDPLAGMGMGLWLSAGAVFALIWLKSNAWHIHWKLPILMAPMTSVWLQSAWIGPAANMFAIPFVSFVIVPGALISVLGLTIGFPGSESILICTGWLIDKLWQCLVWLNTYAVMHHWSLLTWMDKILFTTLIACLLLPWRFVGATPILILMSALSWPKEAELEPGTVVMHVIDAGQGTAIWIQVENKHLLFDAGNLIVKDYLRHHHVDSLDVAIISHNDTDHRAGFAQIVQDIPMKKVYSGETLTELPAHNQLRCLAGEGWSWGSVRFEFISPLFNGEKGNNASCVLKISSGKSSLLLTGDMEAKAERALLAEYDAQALRADVLIAPHHGSKTSSTVAFLQAVSPQIVIYPTGFLNSYHHPHPDIVKRYTEIHAKQYNTAQDGALRVKLSEQGIESIRCYNQDQQRWWKPSEEATCSGYLVQAGQ